MTYSPVRADGPARKDASSSAPPPPASLRVLYAVRGCAAVIWSVVFAAAGHDLTPTIRTLLVLYPVIDVIATAVDARGQRVSFERNVLWFDVALSTVAAIALGWAGSDGIPATLRVFGAWATVSGLVQVAVALRRRDPSGGGQWPMLVAGGLSTLVGIAYNVQAASSHPDLSKLVAYSAAGGVFFILQAAILAWRSRRRRT